MTTIAFKLFFIPLLLLFAILGFINYAQGHKTPPNTPENTQETPQNAPKGQFAVIEPLSDSVRKQAVLDYFWYRLWLCESSYMPDVIHLDSDNLLAYGPVQFKMKTFNSFGEKYGLPHDDILSPIQQRAIWEKMLKDGYEYLWGCSKPIGMNKWKDF